MSSSLPTTPAPVLTHWTVSHGLSGYLPMSDDTTAWLSWTDARAALLADMRDYADTNDDAAWDVLTMSPAADYPQMEDGSPDYGDDAPTMLATVDAMIADGDVAPTAGEEWSGYVDDSDGRTIYFSLSRHESSECEDSCDVIGGWCVGTALGGETIGEELTFADWSAAADQFRAHLQETAEGIGATLPDSVTLADGQSAGIVLDGANGLEYLIYLSDD